MKKAIALALPMAAMLALSACANNMYAEVARFHSNQPMNRGSVAIVSAVPENQNSVEFQTHAETVAVEMRRHGFTTGLPANQVQYIATLDITQSDGATVVRPGTTVNVPVGPLSLGVPSPTRRSNSSSTIRTTTVQVQIKRASDGVAIWEGRASKDAAVGTQEATLTWAVPALAGALFQDFPGRPGVTKNVRL